MEQRSTGAGGAGALRIPLVRGCKPPASSPAGVHARGGQQLRSSSAVLSLQPRPRFPAALPQRAAAACCGSSCKRRRGMLAWQLSTRLLEGRCRKKVKTPLPTSTKKKNAIISGCAASCFFIVCGGRKSSTACEQCRHAGRGAGERALGRPGFLAALHAAAAWAATPASGTKHSQRLLPSSGKGSTRPPRRLAAGCLARWPLRCTARRAHLPEAGLLLLPQALLVVALALGVLHPLGHGLRAHGRENWTRIAPRPPTRRAALALANEKGGSKAGPP